MLTSKKTTSRRARAVLAGALLAVCCGCQPSGPKALLQGAKDLREGNYPRALQHLELAAKLMPAQPQVWNHLGLAWHGSRQPQKAAEAYGRALRIDPKLAAARFNLGMLLLEEDRPAEAAAELSVYVSLQPTNAAGISKLGAALLQARRPDEAERALRQALRLNPRDAEAHNNLGMIHAQRKRGRDAMLEFNAALENRPGYPAALLNQAIVAQLYFGRTEMALERYRAYLSASKDGRWRPEVTEIVSQLEEAGRPPAPAAVAAVTNKFNLPAVAAAPAARTNATMTNAVTVRPPARTNAVAAVVHPAKAPPPSTNEMKVALARPAPVEPPPAATRAPVETASPAREPVEVEVVREPEFQPPKDVAEEPRVANAQPAGSAAPDARPLIAPRRERQPEEKRGFFERANPLHWFRGEEKEAPVSRPPARTIPSQVAAPAEAADAGPARRVPPQFERYHYLKDAPAQGDRAESARYFVLAARAHQEHRLGTALELYRQAAAADPTYFDAQYNLGLVAYQLKDLPLALRANESARTLRPASADARYHFAMALQVANYPVDAAHELRELIAQNPDETRAHLALGNLYAQVLDEAALAARQYNRVLELAPNHPEATAIRQWLATPR